MEQAIISLVSLSVAVALYLDRGRRADFRQLEGRLDERFAGLEKRFEKIDKRFENLDKRFENLDKRFEKIDERFARLDKRFENLDKRFARLEEKLEKRISDSAARTDARINDLNRSVIELAQSVGRAEGRTETLAAVE